MPTVADPPRDRSSPGSTAPPTAHPGASRPGRRRPPPGRTGRRRGGPGCRWWPSRTRRWGRIRSGRTDAAAGAAPSPHGSRRSPASCGPRPPPRSGGGAGSRPSGHDGAGSRRGACRDW